MNRIALVEKVIFVMRMLLRVRPSAPNSPGTRDQQTRKLRNALLCVAGRVESSSSSHSLRDLTDRYGYVAIIIKLLGCHSEGRNVLA